jgi:Zn-dependent protease
MNLMSKSWPLFRALSVPVRVHISFLGVLAFVAFTNLAFIPLYLILIASVLVHEYGHVLAARHFGTKCEVIFLHFFGGAAMMHPSKSLKEDWMVAIAGPLVSLGLSVMFAGVYTFTGIGIIYMAAYLNLIIGLFNLLPIYPMDGGRIYKAFWEYLFGNQVGTLIAVYTARVLAVAAAVYGIMVGAYVLVALAIFIVYFGHAEQLALKRRNR